MEAILIFAYKMNSFGSFVQVKDGVVHSRPMLSLSNTYNEEEVIKFDQRITKLLEGEVRFWKFGGQTRK
jgi:NAD-dependent DNA ligase